MAQREEEELQVPEGLTMCANSCGRPGNPPPRTCARVASRRRSPSPPPPVSASRGPDPARYVRRSDQRRTPLRWLGARVPEEGRADGFRCRCGQLFCAEHRYSDRHDCSYDYKTAAREIIERANPVVKASKVVRI
ncbi:unnamed protein product [Spirodela intermedia]|uniref:AN1-type domain-containing protein n=1 Tax=Spirodela intermedia TaxID=51605 RepID=A0A7I8JQ97_SPIIN|nr:unnamed protein product [Spirodela intermedia]CAA6672337.1 unnamed protein product [Spirodela intermedia]